MAHENVIEINGKQFVTVKALSQMLSLHKRTLQLWATQHRMPLIRIGNLMLFDLEDISRWLIKHKRHPAA